ncbi:hypothetical protein [Facklamia hominis]|uniref:Uncharacterized protein n=1 Tax=Facklamia hominis CCUG 36813 TaxID=883111 RepID=K1LJY9_9LACT|nr:hypothetical protein [Facklamia hominis]EKB54941.1 hypothetical protein HMPREF9706_01131 [Facklamia hominis CCUG 36813]
MKKTLSILLASALLLSHLTTVLATDDRQNNPEGTEPPTTGSTTPTGDQNTGDQTTGGSSKENQESSQESSQQKDKGNPEGESKEEKESNNAVSENEESTGDKTDQNNNNSGSNTPAVTPSVPRPTNPSNYHPVTPTVPTDSQEVTHNSEETTQEEGEVESSINLLEGDFVTFHANIFTSEAEADHFMELIDQDPATKDRFVAEKEVVSEDFVIVKVTYAEEVEEAGRYIIFYVASEFETQEEAQQYLDHNLRIYPDIFNAGQVLELEQGYDVIFGIRPKADTQALTYDEESLEIEYKADRLAYTYTVDADPVTGEFNDEIQKAVIEAFPDTFEFSQVELDSGRIEVTMTPIIKDQPEETTQQE